MAKPWNAPLTLEERIRLKVAELVFRLPAVALVKLSGKPPVRHGDDVLHPELQLLLAMGEKMKRPRLTDLSVDEGRHNMRRECFVFAGPPVSVGAVETFTIPAPHGDLSVRHYAPPATKRPAPLLVFFHGGGFSLGDLETHDAPCRLLCREAGIHVLSVDYRLAPEFPFPAALEDAAWAFTWALEHAAELGADPARVGVGGDSAGANLATVITQIRAAAGQVLPSLQVLIYPVVEVAEPHASRQHFANGFLLTERDIALFGERYAPGADPTDPRLSPLRFGSLAGLPPAIIATAAFDPLRDEGDAYARVLTEAGTRVRHLRLAGMIHGFINLIGVSPACRQATIAIADAVSEEWRSGETKGEVAS